MLARVGLLFAAAALLLLGATVSASGSDVLILDPNNFDDFVGGDLPVFVEFFAPSAGQHALLLLETLSSTATCHSHHTLRNVRPVWTQVVRTLQGAGARV